MVTVGSKELKNRLGRYLELVREGKPVQITDRGRPIGCIIPLSGVSKKNKEDAEILARLAAEGTLHIGTGRLGRLRKPVVMTPGISIEEIVAEDRR